MAVIRPLKELASVKFAIEVCNHPDIKGEIFSVPWSGFEKDKWKIFSFWDTKIKWNERVQKMASAIMINSNFPRMFQEQTLNFLMPVARRMVFWAKHLEKTFDLPSNYLTNFSNSSLYLSNGLIDDAKAAAVLVKDETLAIEKRFKIACHYCCTEDIVSLYRQIPEKDKKKYYSFKTPQKVNQSALVKFWSYFIEGEIDILKGEGDINRYGLNSSIDCGSKTAVKHFWKKLGDSTEKDFAVPVALKILESINESKLYIPKIYFVDILFFLFSEMEEDQQVKFLRMHIENLVDVCILKHCLKWPYQDNFMKIANAILGILPEDVYCDLLMMISDTIEIDENDIYKKPGEDKCYDYRTLLTEFWSQSPDGIKRFFFSYSGTFGEYNKAYSNFGGNLLRKLFLLNNFTSLDKKNIELVLSAATEEEKLGIIHSDNGRDICLKLAARKKWEILEEFITKCNPSEKLKKTFKKSLSFSPQGMCVCRSFVQEQKYDSAEMFLKWSDLSDKEIIQLKQTAFFCEPMNEYLIRLLLVEERKGLAEKTVRWYLSSEEKISYFKNQLLFSDKAIYECARLIEHNTFKGIECIEKFIEWSNITYEDDIRQFKDNLVYMRGISICKTLICDSKWEEAEIFLNWCFHSEETITEFKNAVLPNKLRTGFHFHLIEDNKWEEAEIFFYWLGLSALEIRELKKETLFKYQPAMKMFDDLIFITEGSETYCKYGGRFEAIELFLRWYLTDREAVLEFKHHFEQRHQNMIYKKFAMRRFRMMIEERLTDIDGEQTMLKTGIKRKPEFYNQRERSKILKLDE